MSQQPFFSLVIPCYNDGRYAPGQYIDRLLTSVLDQGLDKADIEVIIADDHSPLPYGMTLDNYQDKLNIKEVKTDYNFGPGNTRQKGSEAATGQWLCFADHDDLFYPGALSKVKSAIEASNEQYLVRCDFNKVYHSDLDKVIEEFKDPHLRTWVHGKFYNLENFWRKFNIHFIKDLKTHEDIALGNLVDCALHTLGDPGYLYLKTPVYKWVHNKDSVSHGTYVDDIAYDGNVHPFLERQFEDFITSQVYVFIEAFREGIVNKDAAMMMCIAKVCSLWFQSSSFKYSNPDGYLKENDAYCSKAWHTVKDEFGMTLSGVKVIVQKAFSDLKVKVDVTASEHNVPDLFTWLESLENMDYKSELDRIKAETIRKSRQAKSNGSDLNSNRPFFSLVIACYNDGRYEEGVYLDRLLASVARQNIAREDLEVILSDDCSPVPFDSIVAKYEDRLLIKRTKTDYNFAPGNTRAKGVELVTGQWLCFADHDDIFYDDALNKVKQGLIEKNEKHYAFGLFYGIDPKTGEVKTKYERMMNWCHAKFYNMDNLWKPYNIHFIHDLKSHEDIAICTQVSCALQDVAPEGWTYFPYPVYAWSDNPQSVSHAKYTVDTETGPREFLEVFFADYIQSTGYIYLEQFKTHSIKMAYAIKSVLEIMCYCYFYTQGFQFRRPDDFYKANLAHAGNFVRLCKETFNMTNQSMYNAISSNNAYMYYNIRKLADPGSGRYIPVQTLKEWFELVCDSYLD